MFDLNMHILKFINLVNALNSIIRWKKKNLTELHRMQPSLVYLKMINTNNENGF